MSSLKENLQVSVAAAFGIGSPGLNLVLNAVEPALRAGLLIGQLGVAIVTILYIYRKWKQAGKKTRRSTRKTTNETP